MKRHLISSLFILQPHIHIIHDISGGIAVYQDNGILVSAPDLDKIIVENSKQNQSVHIPGQNIPDKLLNIVGRIDHHEISPAADLCLNRPEQYAEKRICHYIVILSFSALYGNADDLGTFLRQAPRAVIRDIIIFFQ